MGKPEKRINLEAICSRYRRAGRAADALTRIRVLLGLRLSAQAPSGYEAQACQINTPRWVAFLIIL
ncbi:hypothetical protein SAMN05216315_1321 [Nitrosospira sp. Nsp18]|nr:hypothetical protein SAMN05216315_1321 [Nitrosospira sp. Nsp18]